MGLLRITGHTQLSGTVPISGRKNAALKLIAASVLSDKPVTLHRLPDIGDVRVMLEILERMGASIHREGESVTIHTENLQTSEIPLDLGRKLRASLVLVGPLLSRFKNVRFPHPGGCVIGKRSIRPHLDAFAQLGATIDFDGTWYTIHGDIHGSEVYLKEKTVTGTENLIMAACRADGTTSIWNAAEETHISNLCELLRNMGYAIHGDGTSRVTIEGNPHLSTNQAEVTVIPDEIEIGTFAIAALVTQGTVRLENVGKRHDLIPILSKLDDFNARYEYNGEDQSLTMLPSPDLKAADVQTNPWPGFPPDLQSPFTVLATQATGTSLIHDWMYEGRLYFVDLLQKMGANITICDPHRALVTGPTTLRRNTSITPDLRAGAALVLAA
ncbi:MAG TPA: UDP-N-acetylglucosamine 1-carboxyvinyltransferase, partial [Verrucomicrobiae bacterium]|nr:UDP-N-acetylglucosamine 1-carboxyvinyltransferase [Verrucomicrobiae bacterium]